MIEVVMNGLVHRGEFLQRTHSPEPVHRAFASPRRLVQILRPIVDPTAVAFLACSIADHLHGRATRRYDRGA